MRRVVAALLLLSALTGVSTAQTTDDLFASDTIRDLHLTMSERDWAQLRETYLLNTYYTADVRVVLGGVEVAVQNVGVRSRGTGSRSGVKPALKIDIGRYVRGQRFLGLRSLILRNLLQDPSMVREHVTFALQRRMGLPAPRTVFVRLFVNQLYSGLYELAEDVDEEFLDRLYGEHDGYLYEYAWISPYYFDDLGPGLDRYAVLWEAKTRSSESTFALYSPFEAMARAIAQSRLDDFSTAVGRHLDLREVLRLAAADNFMADWDGMLGYAGLNNIYLYRPVDRPAVIIPWDKDNTFHDVDWPVFEGTAENALMRRALQIPALRAVYVDALREAARIAVTPADVRVGGAVTGRAGWLEAVVESAAGLIRKSGLSDTRKPQDNAAFDAALAEARRFARLRPAVVDAQLAGQ